MNALRPVGELLRDWRQRRRMSQLSLACEADISTRHLSFVETGRAQPSRDMILHLADRLDVPPRERNILLVAAGFAPIFPARPLEDPALGAARDAIAVILERQQPYPAFALDRHWRQVATNGALPGLYAGIAAHLMQAPINVLRLSLHPDGLARRIVNLGEWRAHLLDRLRRQIEITADPVLADLMQELSAYPAGDDNAPDRLDPQTVLIPLRIATDFGVLSLFSTTTVFGTPVDVTLSELALELFFPADADADRIVQRMST
jgi:transcriptional regulator with XRE-family HTH domain